MKRMFIAVVALALGGCMTDDQWAYVKQPRDAKSATASSNIGCLGSTLKDCLHVTFDRFDFSNAQTLVDQMNRNNAVDVNGKRVVAQRSLLAVGRIHGLQDSSLVTLEIDYTDAGIVNGMAVGLPRDPALAQTEQEYRDSGLYEAFSLVLGGTCASMDRLGLYRFFENDVKPHIKRSDKSIDVTMTSANESYLSQADGDYCGTHMKYTSGFGVDTNLITLENPHGSYVVTTIALSPNTTHAP